MAGLTIGKFAAAEGVGVGGEVVRQVVGAKSRSALLRDFADLI